MILHVVNQRLSTAPDFVAPGDAIVLIENGVYSRISARDSDVYCLSADCDARGVSVAEGMKTISYEEFVTLCTEFDKVVTW